MRHYAHAIDLAAQTRLPCKELFPCFCLAGKFLTLNPSKCCHLLISRKRGYSIPPCKYLGVLITSDPMWSSHIAKMCNKTRKLIGLLYRTFYKHSTVETMLKLYCAFITIHKQTPSHLRTFTIHSK